MKKGSNSLDESEYIERLIELWPQGDVQSCHATIMDLSQRAVRDHPESAKLLCMRGDLLQIAPSDYEMKDSPKQCYLRAVQIDPECHEGWESLGYYYDAIEDDYVRAIEAFRRAIDCGAGFESILGLARVLAENSQIQESLYVIGKALAEQLNEAERVSLSELRHEIENGEWTP